MCKFLALTVSTEKAERCTTEHAAPAMDKNIRVEQTKKYKSFFMILSLTE